MTAWLLLVSVELDSFHLRVGSIFRGDDLFTFRQPLQHLEVIGVAPAEAYFTPAGEAARSIEHKGPVAASILEKAAARQQQCFTGIAKLHPGLQRLATAYVLGCSA